VSRPPPGEAADPAPGERIGPWRSYRGADSYDALSAEELIELLRELGVSIADQQPDGMRSVGQHHAQVAGLLAYPCSDRVGGDPGQVNPSGAEIDEVQHVETAMQHRVDGEDVISQHG
jgi:hypothetical protein